MFGKYIWDKAQLMKSNPFVKILTRDLCNCDDDRTLRLEVYDWNSSGTKDFIGSCDTTLRKLR